ncbi:MAG: hypothetical protein H6531_01465 [Actinobacteria bacterium]|nr:hypothetical protein [Actinomycetota bacterium]
MTGTDIIATLDAVLDTTGLAVPRGLAAERIDTVAAALADGGPDLDTALAEAVPAIWPVLRHTVSARLTPSLVSDPGLPAAARRLLMEWASSEDDDHPLARALVVRAAKAQLGVRVRVAEMLRGLEPSLAEAAGRDAAVAVARACGGAVVLLLDLDPDDFADEIVTYVDAGETAEAMDVLARVTGDLDTRRWARDAIAGLDVEDAPVASAALRALVEGPPPDDAAVDAAWVPTLLALVDEGFERALVAEA